MLRTLELLIGGQGLVGGDAHERLKKVLKAEAQLLGAAADAVLVDGELARDTRA
jgi:hypothetical protein